MPLAISCFGHLISLFRVRLAEMAIYPISSANDALAFVALTQLVFTLTRKVRAMRVFISNHI